MAKDEFSIDEEIIRKLMDLRTYLESKMKQIEDEQDKLRTLFRIVDEVIVSKSFRRAEPTQIADHPIPSTSRSIETKPSGEEIPLKTQNGVLLANMYVTETEAQIVLAGGVVLTVNTPPFQSFLLGRILESMRMKDLEAVRSGARSPDQAYEYEVIREGDVLKKIVVKNYGDPRRMREIMTATRWTLEKMSQKVSSPSDEGHESR